MLALVCPRHDIWETSADIPHWWCISRQLWVVPDWLCREKNSLQPQRKTTKIYHLGSEPHQFGISTYVLSFLMEISGGVMKIMSATFSGYSNRNAAEKGQLNLHCTSLGLPMHCNAGQVISYCPVQSDHNNYYVAGLDVTSWRPCWLSVSEPSQEFAKFK